MRVEQVDVVSWSDGHLEIQPENDGWVHLLEDIANGARVSVHLGDGAHLWSVQCTTTTREARCEEAGKLFRLIAPIVARGNLVVRVRVPSNA